MSAPAPAYPHVRGVRRYAFASLVVAAGAAFSLQVQGTRPLFGFEPPAALLLALLVAGAALGTWAARSRNTLLGPIAATLLVLGVLPAGPPTPTLATYALGILFGVALLAMIELIHMTERYARAYSAVESANVPEDHVNRVTDEAKKTLTTRSILAVTAVGTAVGIAYALAAWGPPLWRAAAETRAPLGVTVVALVLALAASLFILARGAKVRLRRESPPKELLPDVAE